MSPLINTTWGICPCNFRLCWSICPSSYIWGTAAFSKRNRVRVPLNLKPWSMCLPQDHQANKEATILAAVVDPYLRFWAVVYNGDIEEYIRHSGDPLG